MCTKSDLSYITADIARAYREIYQADLRKVYLYGSYARGDHDSESDIDIAAVVDGDRMELQKKLKQVWDTAAELGLQYDVVVSPTVIPESEFVKFGDVLPYYRNIRMEGVEIHV